MILSHFLTFLFLGEDVWKIVGVQAEVGHHTGQWAVFYCPFPLSSHALSLLSLSFSQSQVHPKACNNNPARTRLLGFSTSTTQQILFPKMQFPFSEEFLKITLSLLVINTVWKFPSGRKFLKLERELKILSSSHQWTCSIWYLLSTSHHCNFYLTAICLHLICYLLFFCFVNWNIREGVRKLQDDFAYKDYCL